MKKFIIMSAALLAFASCAQDQNEPAAVVADDAVSFDTSLGEVTVKGVPVEGTALKQNFGVYAYKNASNGSQDNLVPDFFYNQLVSYHSGKFSYSPTVYWPSQGKVNFFAYTPYHMVPSEFLHPSSHNDKGYPEIKYKVKSIVKDQEDYMVAEVLNQDKECKPVKLHFKHALTKIGFLAHLEEDYPGCVLKIKSVKVENVKDTGTFNYKDFYENSDKWWKDLSGSADYTIGLVDNKDVTVSWKDCKTLADHHKVCAEDQYLLAMPQSFKYNKDAEIVVVYTITENGKTKEYTSKFDLKSCDDWEPGSCILYCLKFKMEEVCLDAVVQPWKTCKEEELWLSGSSNSGHKSYSTDEADVAYDEAI